MISIISLADIDKIDDSANEFYNPGQRPDGTYGNCTGGKYRVVFHLKDGTVRRFESGWIVNPSGSCYRSKDGFCVIDAHEVAEFSLRMERKVQPEPEATPAQASPLRSQRPWWKRMLGLTR